MGYRKNFGRLLSYSTLKNKSYRAEVVKADRATKTFQFKINNKIHTVEVKDKFDLLLEKMGMTNGASAKNQ